MDVKDTLPRLKVDRAWVAGVNPDWAYAHHPYLTKFNGTWVAMWSSSRRDEDDAGQRVAFATSSDMRTWTTPAALAEPGIGKDGKPRVLTPAGFLTHDGSLTAFYSSYEHDMTGTRMFAARSRDGVAWDALVDIGVASCPNAGPRAIEGGRLLLAGNTVFPYTDDPSGLTGWKVSALHASQLTDPEDNPRTFWEVRERAGWPAGLCSAAFFETKDGNTNIVRMLLRSRRVPGTGPDLALGGGEGWRLWLSESRDRGETWSPPRPTEFLDNDASFQFGRLPDGRVWYVGFPDPARGWARSKLILSISRDGMVFDEHHVIADEPYDITIAGKYKLGEYSYPHASVVDGNMCIIVSREKEAMEVIWFSLDQVRQESPKPPPVPGVTPK